MPPGTSTNRTCAGTVFLERSISVRTARRGSGTGTTATLACPPCEPARVSARNRVDFPEKGTPTSPMSRIGRPTYQPEVGQLSTFGHYATVGLLTDAAHETGWCRGAASPAPVPPVSSPRERGERTEELGRAPLVGARRRRAGGFDGPARRPLPV